MTKFSVFLLLLNFLISGSSYTQNNNALMQNDLVMYDRIPLDSSHYSKGEENEYDIFYKQLHFKNKLLNNINIKKVITDYLLNTESVCYENYEPYISNIYKDHKLKVLSNNEKRINMGEYTDTIMVYDPDIGEFMEKIIKNHVDTLGITGILFYDKWIFDEENFKMYKDVTAYSPIRSYYRPDDPGKFMPLYKLVGWIVHSSYKNKKEKKIIEARMKHFYNVSYEYYINNIELHVYRIDENLMQGLQLEKYLQKHDCVYWNTFAREKFKHLVTEDVLKGTRDAFDFNTNEKLTLDESKKRMGNYTDTVFVPDIKTGNMIPDTFERKADLSEIKSFIFIEDWYIDEISLRIKKEVLAVAPVRIYYADDDIERKKPKKIIPFLIYFN